MPLYAFGSNGSGQLAIGHVEDVSTPTKCIFASEGESGGTEITTTPTTITANNPTQNEQHGEQLTHIAAGGNHTLALFASGAVYAAGSNANGTCAHDPEKDTSILEFMRVAITIKPTSVDEADTKSDESIRQFSSVSATWEASFFVHADRKHIYVAGLGMKGELGLGQGVTEAKSPVEMSDFPPVGTEIVHISSSMGHTVVVLSSGEVYGWGNARKGQVGADGIKNKICWVPKKIELDGLDLFPTAQVACGREFTVIAGRRKEGERESSIGIIGSDKWNILSGAPQKVKGYKILAASWHGVYIQKDDGSVLAWGRNDRGQLPVQDLPNLTRLAVGSEHVLGVIDGTKLIAFGWGEHGNCGSDTDAQGNVAGRWSEIPIKLEVGSTISAVGAGCATSWVWIP